MLNPLSVKTKTNTLADGRVALEAQLQNLCSLPIYLERMNFEPNDLFNFVDYNYLEDAQLFQPMISSQSIRQYLYMIEPKSKGIQAKMTPQLGKLDISWQTAFGQTGKLGTAWLVRKIVDTDPFDVIIVAQSPNTRAEQSFTVKCRVRNHSSEVVRIQIRGNKSNMCNVLMNGPNQLLVGNVDPESSVEFDLDLFSLSAGQFRITGLVAVDQISGISKELDQLAMIQVT